MPENEAQQEPRSKEEQLAVLENEISQAEQSLEANFAKFAADSIDEKLEELFFENKEEFIKTILGMQNAFLKENYDKLIAKRDALKGEIAQDEAFSQIEAAQNAFIQKHPDADMNALMQLYNEELGPRYKKELDKLAPEQFFETLYQIYQQKGAIEGKQASGDNPPKHLNANASDAEQSGYNDEENPMTRL